MGAGLRLARLARARHYQVDAEETGLASDEGNNSALRFRHTSPNARPASRPPSTTPHTSLRRC